MKEEEEEEENLQVLRQQIFLELWNSSFKM